MKRVVARVHAARTNINDWRHVLATASSGLKLHQLLSPLVHAELEHSNIRPPGLMQVFELNAEALLAVMQTVHRVVDFDESKAMGRCVVKPNVYPELDDLKASYEDMDDILSQLVARMLHEIPQLGSEFVPELNLTYIPQIGYSLMIPVPENGMPVPIEGLELQFGDSTYLYYKNEYMRTMDAEFGDIYHLILDREAEIFRELETYILQDEIVDVLFAVEEAGAILDCVTSLAAAALEYNFKRPRVVHESVLVFKEGRHPLQELCVPVFIPNDCTMFEDAERIKILTGPNYSGKSVYIKTCAVITYLAHIGSFVPADEATIGITDRIFTRIVSRESVSTDLSVFMIDVSQISVILSSSLPTSLVLIDEFGKGTDPLDGVSLMAGVITHLAGRPQPPRTLISTHYGELFQMNLLPESPQLDYCSMKVVRDEAAATGGGGGRGGRGDGGEGEALVFLYTVEPGRCISSHAALCASRADIPAQVVERGVDVAHMIQSGDRIAPLERESDAAVQRNLSVIRCLQDFDCENGDLHNFFTTVAQIQQQ